MVSSLLQPTLARAAADLDRGHAEATIERLTPMLRTSLRREDELTVRAHLAEAHLLTGDLAQAAATLGRPPDAFRGEVSPVITATLWRLHGRVAYGRGEQSRAIALHGRALKQAEAAHDSRAIGRTRYELALCYTKVAANTVVREHIAESAAALHAAGDKRYLALVQSLSAMMLAQSGRFDEATAALRLAEHQASAVGADDVLAIVCVHQANVALLRHRYDQALALAERAVALQEALGRGHGMAVALATLGQICVRMGDLQRAEQVLQRALQARTPVHIHETTGAVNDTLAQMSLMRGDYESAAAYLQHAADAYGAYGRQTSRWYEWSVRVISARLALSRGLHEDALALANEIAHAPSAPPGETLEGELIAIEALLIAERLDEAEQRLQHTEGHLDPRAAPGAWGEYLRLRGDLRGRQGRTTESFHDFAQSSSVFELVGERYQSAVSQLALGRLAAKTGARSTATRHFQQALQVFEGLGAVRDKEAVQAAMAAPVIVGTGDYIGSPADADDALVRRLVDAAMLPDLLARELTAAVLETVAADLCTVFVALPAGDVRVVAAAGADAEAARTVARRGLQGGAYGTGSLIIESLGRDVEGRRALALASSRPLSQHMIRRVRMLATVARQGFELTSARERPAQSFDPPTDRLLEPLLPGFVCASAAMHRVVEQVQRLQGNDLTALITGESGTGKELIAQAIHVGSSRSAATFLPYNCTTTTRELADSQLFGHRRGAFTGAVSEQPGLIRSASGGTLFLDEVGDLPPDVQPKLLRFLEAGEIMPVGDTRPLRVDVRIVTATNADLEQRVAEGKFREDLYYRLSVIRIHIPPLRQRREEIPHLTTFFLRDACERLVKPDVRLSTGVLEVFSQYWWPGNVRQLRNEIRRAVAMTTAGAVVEPEHLSADLTLPPTGTGQQLSPRDGDATHPALVAGQTLASAVDDVERTIIKDSLSKNRGNISETARSLGLTRRGLYLKLRRLGLEGPSELHTN